MNEISLLNGTIKGVRWGKGDQKLLALHGFLDHANSFKLLAQCMPDVEIWAIDLPGHGLSDALPKSDGVFILQWLPTLGRVLDELGWQEVSILGHSMGAIVSQLLAAVDPRVFRLYSMDALGPLASSTEQNLERYQRLYDARNEQFTFRTYGSHQTLIKTRLKGMFPLSERAAEVMAQRAVGWSKSGWYHRYDRRLRQESLWRMSESEVLAWLGKIECPVELLLFNAHQWAGYQQVFEQRQAAVKQLSIEMLEGSHHLHLESPELVAQWLKRKLAH